MLPVVGLGVGVTQVVRGVANTPEAIKQAKKGMCGDTVHMGVCMLVLRRFQLASPLSMPLVIIHVHGMPIKYVLQSTISSACPDATLQSKA